MRTNSITGEKWLKQWLIAKANECIRLEQEACYKKDWHMSNVYISAWFKLANIFLNLK